MMSDCLSWFTRHQHGSDENSFPTMTAMSSNILDFETPSEFNLLLSKSISPYLKSNYSLGIPSSRSVAFLYSTLPMKRLETPLSKSISIVHKPDIHNLHSFLDYAKLQISEANINVPHTREYLLYGSLFQDLRVEGIYLHSLSKRWLLQCSGISHWQPNVGNFNIQLMRFGKYSNFQAVFSSQDQIMGTNFLFQVPRLPLSLGGEMYYTGKEKSGNLALGLCYKNLKKACWSVVTNPIVGYWSTAYTAYIRPNFIMATRYNINIYSYQTNLSVGCEYVPKDTDHLLKLRISEQDGLALFYVTKLNQFKVGFGFQTELTKNPRRSFGAEMNIEL